MQSRAQENSEDGRWSWPLIVSWTVLRFRFQQLVVRNVFVAHSCWKSELWSRQVAWHWRGPYHLNMYCCGGGRGWPLRSAGQRASDELLMVLRAYIFLNVQVFKIQCMQHTHTHTHTHNHMWSLWMLSSTIHSIKPTAGLGCSCRCCTHSLTPVWWSVSYKL